MKKFSKLAVVLLLLSAFALALAACPAYPESIVVSEANPPTKVVYILGEDDLDLSDGKLVVQYKNKTEQVSLNDPKVDITGFDKNKEGEQTLIITYEGKTTEFKVNVVPRIVVQPTVVRDYFVDDVFNNITGQIRVTKNDGTPSNIPISDSKISIVGFDSTTPGLNKVVTLNYKPDDSKDEYYTTTFNVNIYEVENIEIKEGSLRKIYQSHEKDFQFFNSKFVLTGNEGKLIKEVPLSEGSYVFDTSDVTLEQHRTTPLEKDITITYKERDFDIPVEIYFSDVSLIWRRAAELKSAGLNWNSTALPEITDVQGENAVQAMSLYSKLTMGDRALILQDDRELIMRPAAVYGYNKYLEAASNFSNTFTITRTGLVFTGENMDLVKADWEILKNTDNEHLVQMKEKSEVLTYIINNFGAIDLIAGVRTSYYLGYISIPAFITDLPEMLEFTFNLYDSLKDIHAGWAVEDLSDYETQIENAYNLIVGSKFNKNRGLFDMMSRWRFEAEGANDFFDIVYAYYYLVEESTYHINSIKDIYLPGKLETLYNTLKIAISQIYLLQRQSEWDSTLLMQNFRIAAKLANEILDKNDPEYNELHATLFGELKFIGIFESDQLVPNFETLIAYLTIQDFGYFYVYDRLINDVQFTVFWEKYLDIVDRYLFGSVDDELGEDIEDLLASFIALPPVWQASFLNSLNPNYGMVLSGGHAALNLSLKFSFFAEILNSHYTKVLSSPVFEIFQKLLLSLESYAIYQTGYVVNNKVMPVTPFLNYMKDLTDMLEPPMQLTAANEANFEMYLRDFYDTYRDVYFKYKDDPKTPKKATLTPEWQAVFKELADTIVLVATYYNEIYVNSPSEPLYSSYLAAVAYAESLVQIILDNGDKNVIEAYYHDAYTFSSSYSRTLSFAMYANRLGYDNMMTELRSWGNSSVILWYFYTPNHKLFLAKAHPILSGLDVEDEDVFEVMALFRQLPTIDRINFFILIDADLSTYHKILKGHFKNSEKFSFMSELLFLLERDYYYYLTDLENPRYLEILMNSMDYASMAFLAVFDEEYNPDKSAEYKTDAESTAFVEMYEYYRAKYEEIMSLPGIDELIRLIEESKTED